MEIGRWFGMTRVLPVVSRVTGYIYGRANGEIMSSQLIEL